MKKIEFEVTQMYDFDYREIYILRALFQNLQTSKLVLEDHNIWIFSSILLNQCIAFDWYVDGGNVTCSYGDILVWKARKSNVRSIFCNLQTYRQLDWEFKKNSLQLASTSPRFSIKTLMEEIEHLREKCEFEYQNKKTSMTCLNFWDFQAWNSLKTIGIIRNE